MKRTRALVPALALLAIILPAAVVAVLGYVSLRQWERSADLLFQAQARDTASMAAGKVRMALRRAEDDFLARLAAALGGGGPTAVESLLRDAPLVRRLYLFDRQGRNVYPERWADSDATIFATAANRVGESLWERGGRADVLLGDQLVVVAVVKPPGGRPVLAALGPDLDWALRTIVAPALSDLASPTTAAVLDRQDRPVYLARPLDGVERVSAVELGEGLPRWRLALYQSPALSPRHALRRQVRLFGVALGLLVVVIGAGSVTTYRLMRRETEMAQLKADFVANVSHDLKTPLSVIRMYGETLEMGRVTGEAQRQEYYRVIARESERLTRLIENVLDFSRIESGRRAYEMTPTALEPLLRETVEAFAYPLAQGGFEVDVRIAPDLPDVAIDADAVGQSLANLVDNAIKYSGDRRVLTITAAAAAGGVAVTVVDEGIGIPRAEQERIFEKFYRVGRSETQGRRGSGVGLALVRHVAEAHGGRVSVESEPGRGSRFTLWLPVAAGRTA